MDCNRQMSFLQPRLANVHIRLDPLRAEDFDGLYAVAADPLIWAQHPAHDRWQPLVFRAFFDDAMASGGALMARDPANNMIIGSSRYSTSRVEPGELEIGWTFLTRTH